MRDNQSMYSIVISTTILHGGLAVVTTTIQRGTNRKGVVVVVVHVCGRGDSFKLRNTRSRSACHGPPKSTPKVFQFFDQFVANAGQLVVVHRLHYCWQRRV